MGLGSGTRDPRSGIRKKLNPDPGSATLDSFKKMCMPYVNSCIPKWKNLEDTICQASNHVHRQETRNTVPYMVVGSGIHKEEKFRSASSETNTKTRLRWNPATWKKKIEFFWYKIIDWSCIKIHIRMQGSYRRKDQKWWILHVMTRWMLSRRQQALLASGGAW